MVTDRVEKQDPLTLKRWMRMHQTNESQNQVCKAILIFNKVDFDAKLCRRDEEY